MTLDVSDVEFSASATSLNHGMHNKSQWFALLTIEIYVLFIIACIL